MRATRIQAPSLSTVISKSAPLSLRCLTRASPFSQAIAQFSKLASQTIGQYIKPAQGIRFKHGPISLLQCRNVGGGTGLHIEWCDKGYVKLLLENEKNPAIRGLIVARSQT